MTATAIWKKSLVLVFLVLALAIASANAQDGRDLRTPLRLVKGKFGKALDAKNSPAVIEGNLRYRKPPLTVECWAKLNSKKSFNILVASDSKSSSLHWEIFSQAKTGFFSAYLPGKLPAEIHSKVDICDGKWHHLAFTYDGKAVALYVDGNQAAKQEIKANRKLGPQPGPLTIGMVFFRNGRLGCDGSIDEVRISNSIRKIKVPAEPLILDPNTVGLWHFDSLSAFLVDPAWTPRPAKGNVPAWEKETDKDWYDNRFRRMDTGPFFNGTLAYPSWKGKVLAYRGTAIRLGEKGEAAVVFDRNQLRYGVGWTGKYLHHNNRRFGLLNTPRPDGKIVFTTSRGLGWNNPKGTWENPYSPTGPLPEESGKFKGIVRDGKRTTLLYEIGNQQINDSPWFVNQGGVQAFTRTLTFPKASRPMRTLICEMPGAKLFSRQGQELVVGSHDKKTVAVGIKTKSPFPRVKQPKLEIRNGNRIELVCTQPSKLVYTTVLIWQGEKKDLAKFAQLVKNYKEQYFPVFPKRKPSLLFTKGVRAKDNNPLVIDTLKLPFENPSKSLFFLSGLDFLKNGDIAVSTVHGDVWLVRGVNEKLDKLVWQRFASGLYQPLGLKVIGNDVFVLERGQITRLNDVNKDGVADIYHCFADGWHIDGGEHSYDTCLETDPEGNFYFFNTGDRSTPTGGCLLKVSKDGKKTEIFSTGFRHPIGLGMSPEGVITGADQEGNWMPSTRIDIYRKGGFYGDMRTHHRKVPPKTYNPPLCWLPRQLDNSAGGQVWITNNNFGPLSGKMLHLSYGRCRMMLVLPQKVGDTVQAGAVDLGLQFRSGILRGRVSPHDGHLYVVGMDGWQTAAVQDGCLQRVRYTGKQAALPTGLSVHQKGIRLTFSQPLAKTIAEDKSRYRIEQWNYRWSGAYGSKRWSVKNPKQQGQDRLDIQTAKLLQNGRSVFLEIQGLRLVMQMQINFNLTTGSGKPLQGAIYNTIHALGKKLKDNPESPNTKDG